MSPEVISEGDQHGLHPIVSVKAGLEWVQNGSIIQESLELPYHRRLNYLAQEQKIWPWGVGGKDRQVQKQFLKD